MKGWLMSALFNVLFSVLFSVLLIGIITVDALAAENPLASIDDPAIQKVEPFQIFDNLYYVGLQWVAAYVLVTDDGLVVIDSLYGDWVEHLIDGIRKVGLDPNEIKYVICTHGHFDHAGGAKTLQDRYGAKVIMSAEDILLAKNNAMDIPQYAYEPPVSEVGNDGEVIELGDNAITLYKTPGHTEGVLTLTYTVRDGANEYTAITLGGVGLNFSGVERTEMYLKSYARLQSMQDDIDVSLPNHAAMAGVFDRGEQMNSRNPGDPHPFVDKAGYKASLASFVAAATRKLAQEKAGTAPDPMEELRRTLAPKD